MKIIKNLFNKVVETCGKHLDHSKNCSGDLNCTVCDRRMCTRCWSKGSPTPLCLICSGVYSPSGILLYND